MCGIIGVIRPYDHRGPSNWASREVYQGLLTLQHRGQDSAGILSYDFAHGRFFQEKGIGLVASVFNQKNLSRLYGDMAIGHARYATAGVDEQEDLQPMVVGHPFGIGMAHNGNLVNYQPLRKKLFEQFKVQLLTNNDLELILMYWAQYYLEISEDKEFSPKVAMEATRKVMEIAKGAYAVVAPIAEWGMMGFRDPKGIRPLVLGEKWDDVALKKSYCLASETVALNFLGYNYVRDIEPGEFIFISKTGEIISQSLISKVSSSPCMFEWVYFSGAESTWENRSIYSTRLNLGRQLAKKVKQRLFEKDIRPDIVMPVPDTSRTAAIGLAFDLKLPYREGLIKNRYIFRSFILNDQDKREKAVELKLAPVKSEIEGKSILLVDDSVVRGTTCKKIIALLKRYGAREITLAITCPPVRYPCYYGIDFPIAEELLAENKSEEEMARNIQARDVIFLDTEDLHAAIELNSLCKACVDGKYPTDVSEGKAFGECRRKTELNRQLNQLNINSES